MKNYTLDNNGKYERFSGIVHILCGWSDFCNGGNSGYPFLHKYIDFKDDIVVFPGLIHI